MSATLQHHPLGLTWVERGGMGRSAHALASEGRVWLVDPFEDEAALVAAAALGELAGVIQLLDRHNRDCEALAARHGVPHLRLPSTLPGTPFVPFPVIRWRMWNEVALWWEAGSGEAASALVVAEALGTSPLFAAGRAAGVHPMLRLTPPRSALRRYRPSQLLVGHGGPVLSDASAAIDEALAHARGDIPKVLLNVPKLFRG
jgi:hypothetical protein